MFVALASPLALFFDSSLSFHQLQCFKGPLTFQILKARLARESDFWLSELGALSVRRDKQLVWQAGDALGACI